MNGSIKAIETTYDGYRFRSRLEARWAVFFKTLGLSYEYEKEGYDLGDLGWYLPDFWLPCPSHQYPNAGHWFEIKGAEPSASELKRAQLLAIGTKHTTFVAQGLPGAHPVISYHNKGGSSIIDHSTLDVENDPYGLWITMTRWNCFTWPRYRKALIAARQARF